MADFFLKLTQIFVGSAWNRAAIFLILGGVAAINGWVPLAVGSILGIQIQETSAWLGVFLICLGVLVLILNRIIPESSVPRAATNPHDAHLIQQFRALLTPDLVRFLRTHNFRVPFRQRILDPIHEIAHDWNGAHFEFQDVELQSALERVILASRALSAKVMERIYYDRNNPEVGHPLTDVDLRQGVQESTLKAIEEMNELSTAVEAAVNDLERLARRKIPLE